jgi:hypothetical protein
MKLKFLVVLFLLFNLTGIYAQDLVLGAKNWYIYNVGLDVGKNIKTKFTQLYSVDLPDYRLGFVQTDILFAYRIFGKQFIKFEYSLGNYRWSPSLIVQGLRQDILNMVSFNRLNLMYDISHPVIPKIKGLNLTHEIEAQVYFPQPEKHRTRFVYNTTLRYSIKKSKTNISANIGTSIFYYLGGRPIGIYDELGNLTSNSSTNGIHRFRVKGGLSIKPYKKIPFTLSLFALQQWEFNTRLFPNSRLNYTRTIPINSIQYPFNPADFNTAQPFNNYFAMGLSASYTFKFKKKSK